MMPVISSLLEIIPSTSSTAPASLTGATAMASTQAMVSSWTTLANRTLVRALDNRLQK
jgi:hypothetical protein